MAGMNPDALAELRSLQARAYGPDGDIHDDQDALARLQALEAEAAFVQESAGAAEAIDEADEAGAEASTDEFEPAVDAAVDAAVEVERVEASAPDRTFRPSTPWLWLGSLVAVAAIAVLWTFTTMVGVLTPIQGAPETDQVAVLAPDPDFVTPGFFGASEFELTGFADFHGVTLIASDRGWFGAAEDGACLWFVRTQDITVDGDSINGPVYNDCSVGSFPATIELLVDSEMPEELRHEFPVGTALQFVLDGDRVGVFVDSAADE